MRQDTLPGSTLPKKSGPGAGQDGATHCRPAADGTASRTAVRHLRRGSRRRAARTSHPFTDDSVAPAEIVFPRGTSAPPSLSIGVRARMSSSDLYGESRSHVSDVNGPVTGTIPTATRSNVSPAKRPVTAVRILRCECVGRKRAASSVLRKRQRPLVLDRTGKSSSPRVSRPGRA